MSTELIMTPSVVDTERELRVEEVRFVAEDIVSLTLAKPRRSNMPLPAWEAGAHINLELPSGKVRSYSLCGSLRDRNRYTIAVHRSPASRGGSREIHETGLVGRTLRYTGPVNHFTLVDAPAYLFLAGGIGVTPLLPMLETVRVAELPRRFVYGGRSVDSMAFIPRILETSGSDVTLVCQDTDGLPDIAGEIAAAPPGAAIYCCGPESMLQAVTAECESQGVSAQLHVEHFNPPVIAPTTSRGSRKQNGFEVVLARTGKTVEVPPRRSILNTIKKVVPDVTYGCARGFCRDCETTVLEGTPDHRDFILTPEERESGKTMMICVSRCEGDRLVLDL